MVDIAENAAAHFVDRHATGADPGKTAFVEASGERRSLSYRDLAEQTGRLAHLLERHGVQPENRVALLLLDRIEFPIVFWGCLKAGVIPVALNTLLATDVYGAILRDSRARALFVSHELLPIVAPLLNDHPYLKKVFVVGGEAPGALDFASELAAGETRPPIAVSADECAFWLYSSGSTGRAQGRAACRMRA